MNLKKHGYRVRILLIISTLVGVVGAVSIVRKEGAAKPIVKNKNTISQAIFNAQVPLFSSSNIFAEKFNQSNVNDWYTALKEAENYVRKISKNPELNKYFQILNTANDNIINSIKVAYNKNLANVAQEIKQLESAYNNTQQLEANLQAELKGKGKSSYFSRLFSKVTPSGQEKDALELLNIINTALNLSSKTALKHLRSQAAGS